MSGEKFTRDLVLEHALVAREVAETLITAIGRWSVGEINNKALRNIGISEAKKLLAKTDETVAGAMNQ